LLLKRIPDSVYPNVDLVTTQSTNGESRCTDEWLAAYRWMCSTWLLYWG